MHRWHIIREDRALTLSRHAAPLFDVAAEADFPMLRKLPLAQMIRQDMWRLLRSLRGFAPVVRVEEIADGLHVKAGGKVPEFAPKMHTEAQIRALLENACKRARWARCARLTLGKDMV